MNLSQQNLLLKTLQERFELHQTRHPKISWNLIESKLLKNKELLAKLFWMEETGGEPDVLVIDEKTSQLAFVDCSEQSPKGRRSLCYDDLALKTRKENKPKGSALGVAFEQGLVLLNEDQYRVLQTKGSFDTKSSSWVLTPESMRKLGGALFGDNRYDRTFFFHNGAESYYADRGFRVFVLIP